MQYCIILILIYTISVDKFGRTAVHLQHKYGFENEKEKHVELEMKKIKHLGMPVDDFDAVNKSYVDTSIQMMQYSIPTRSKEEDEEIVQRLLNIEKTKLLGLFFDYLINPNTFGGSVGEKERSDTDVITVGLLRDIIEKWRTTN
jgi:hypothetical protein